MEHLQGAILGLPERYRLILEGKYILEMNDDEIAEQFSIKPTSVREYLTRARRKVYTILKEGDVLNGKS